MRLRCSQPPDNTGTLVVGDTDDSNDMMNGFQTCVRPAGDDRFTTAVVHDGRCANILPLYERWCGKLFGVMVFTKSAVTCPGVHAGTMVTAQTNPDDDEEPMFMQYFRGGKGGNVRSEAAKGATAAPAASPQFRTVRELLFPHLNTRPIFFGGVLRTSSIRLFVSQDVEEPKSVDEVQEQLKALEAQYDGLNPY